jgi:Tfp pilus assembly protein PilN
MLKINLLPPSQKQALRENEISRWFLYFFSSLGFLMVIFGLLCLSTYFYLFILVQSQKQAISSAQDKIQSQELKNIEIQISETNQKIKKIYASFDSFIYWTEILEDFSKDIPKGIYLKNLSYRLEDNQIRLDGHANTRQVLLDFEKIIKNNQEFADLESPISNLLKQTDIDFSFNFKIDPQKAKSL